MTDLPDMSRKKLRVMVVAPGAIHSTFDMFQYYLGAFRRSRDVEVGMSYNYHNRILFYDMAYKAVGEATGRDLYDPGQIMYDATQRLLMDVWRKKPDVVFFVCGTGMSSQLYSWINEFRKDTGRNFVMALYITESPYLDPEQEQMMNEFDVVFFNDKWSAEKYNPNGDKFVFYLPHSYDIMTHSPGYVGAEYKRDVFFCGTGFKERGKVFSQVDWTGIDLGLYGHWDMADEEDRVILDPYTTRGLLLNSEVADFYRGSKIGINFHRTSGPISANEEVRHISREEAYSLGPRTIEAAACGMFQLSDYRQELVDIFGDTIPIFNTPEELEDLIKEYLGDDEKRQNMADEARKRVRGMSYDDRVVMLNEIFYEALDTMKLQQENQNG